MILLYNELTMKKDTGKMREFFIEKNTSCSGRRASPPSRKQPSSSEPAHPEHGLNFRNDKMTKQKHTPTPWGTKQFNEVQYSIGPAGQDFFIVAITSQGNDKPNAEFIVRACNCHDELVEALERIAFEPQGPADASCRQVLDACVKIAKQALAKARGE